MESRFGHPRASRSWCRPKRLPARLPPSGTRRAKRSTPAEKAWESVTIDDQWQAEQWGRDSEAEAALEARKRDFLGAARFLDCLES